MKKEELISKLGELIKETYAKLAERPHQFVVAYYKKADDELIGYHADSWCNLTNDILHAKRYADENPYPQLEIISKNLKYALDEKIKESEIFGELRKVIRDSYNGLKSENVYMDAIYLADGTPAKEPSIQILSS